jgi:hypothetical protein
VNREAAQVLGRVLLYGSANSRRAAAKRLVRDNDPEVWDMLVSTVRSAEPWLLRARALEVLGLVVGEADQPIAEKLVGDLLDNNDTRSQEQPSH